MSARRLAGTWLIGLGAGLITLAAVRGDLGGLAFPFLIGATGLLLFAPAGRALRRFPGTELERRLDRLFALLLPRPRPRATSTASLRVVLAHELRLAALRRDARRWSTELQLMATDGYETASRIAALCVRAGEQDDRALVGEVVHVLGAERARAGADPALTDDPVSLLAYGLGARPGGADLTSLEALLRDLGLSEEGDELRTHFDDAVAQTDVRELHLRSDAERSTLRDLAGASFVLGAAARIFELASLAPSHRTIPVAAAAG